MKCVYMFKHFGCGNEATHRYKRDLGGPKSTWRPVCEEHLVMVKQHAKEKLIIQRYKTEEKKK